MNRSGQPFFVLRASRRNDNIPVMITEQQPKLLDRIQDDAKVAADEKTAIIAFVPSEGNMPSRMQGKLTCCLYFSNQSSEKPSTNRVYVPRNRFTAV